MERIKGVDISSWQEGISFEAIKGAGVKFAIIRAGYGKTKDRCMDDFVERCEEYGIKYGFYWYSYALTVERAREEAEFCVRCIRGSSPDYPVYFDMEDKSQIEGLSNRTRTDMAIAFCERIRQARFIPGIYANPNWLENYYKKDELVGRYDIWLAAWTEDPDIPTRYDFGQKVWQWGIDSIGGYNIDGDISYYDYTADDGTEDYEIKIGDIVEFKGGYHYVSSTAEEPTGGVRTAGEARITNIAPNAPHQYALIGIEGGSNVYGWVDASRVEPLWDMLKLGDRVRVKRGAKTFYGGNLAGFVYDNVYVVMQIGSGVSPDYIVIGDGRQVTAAVKAEDLILV